MAPWITTVEQVTIRSQTETMKSVKTVTKDGIEIFFEGIQLLSSVNVGQVIRFKVFRSGKVIKFGLLALFWYL